MTPVKFPNVLQWVEQYLQFWLPRVGFPTARVGSVYRGDSVEVWLQRDGGPTLDVIREVARVRVNCFHDGANGEPVEDFAQTVAALLRAGADGEPVVRVDQTVGSTTVLGPKPQRLMVFELTVRGSQLTVS